jgi:hypothetical protein
MLGIEADALGLSGDCRAQYVKNRVDPLAKKIYLATKDCSEVGRGDDLLPPPDPRFVN